MTDLIETRTEKSREGRLRRLASTRWWSFSKLRSPITEGGQWVNYILSDDRRFVIGYFTHLEEAEEYFEDVLQAERTEKLHALVAGLPKSPPRIPS